MSSSPVDFLVVGGGAAGFFAAIACAEQAGRSVQTLILEKGPRPLAKVLISGGGRCNLTHACYDPAQLVQYYPRGGAALRGAFSRFQPSDTLAWFQKRGVALKTEVDGRIFPKTDSSQTIVDCLLQAAEDAGVRWRTQAGVAAVERNPDPAAPFVVRLRPERQAAGEAGSELIAARRLLLATGGEIPALRLAASLGHTIEPPAPSLFSFEINDPRLRELAGVSVADAELSLPEVSGPQRKGMQQHGPLLVTHWGLSGPAALRLSAWGARWLHQRQYRAALAINWLYPLNQEQTLAQLLALKAAPDPSRQQAWWRDPFQRLPQRLWRRLVEAAGISEAQRWAELSRTTLARLAQELCAGLYQIQGKGQFKDEFVTCGGVRLAEVDFKTMQSRLVPGLYFAGEVLDVDGLTGGFNFQNAWTTGWLAGRAAALSLDATEEIKTGG